MESFLAWIMPISTGGHPEHPIVLPPQQPPGIWPSPGYPSHPIYIPPTGIWPSPGYPAHPIYNPPGIWPSPGYPAHPIVLPPEQGGPPPGIWPSPGFPSHPIAPGGPPPSIWPSPGFPAHPIAPGGPEGGGGGGTVENPVNRPPGDSPYWSQVYIPYVGWVWALVPPSSVDKPQVNPLKGDEGKD
jgi:hypothetical protein